VIYMIFIAFLLKTLSIRACHMLVLTRSLTEINIKKSVCLRVGPRCHSSCSPTAMSDGQALHWVDNISYLGVFISCSTKFSCSFDSA